MRNRLLSGASLGAFVVGSGLFTFKLSPSRQPPAAPESEGTTEFGLAALIEAESRRIRRAHRRLRNQRRTETGAILERWRIQRDPRWLHYVGLFRRGQIDSILTHEPVPGFSR